MSILQSGRTIPIFTGLQDGAETVECRVVHSFQHSCLRGLLLRRLAVYTSQTTATETLCHTHISVSIKIFTKYYMIDKFSKMR